MRKLLIALAAATGLAGLGIGSASAAPVRVPAQASNIRQAEWYCGPRCEYWRHRRWERHEWHEHHPYYSYNNGYYGYRGHYHYYH